jgi:hypothetical protein
MGMEDAQEEIENPALLLIGHVALDVTELQCAPL